MTERNFPKRKRDPSMEVINLSDDSESKMEVDKEIGEDEEVLLVNLSEEDSVLKKLPNLKKKKGHGFVNFMVNLDSDNEDEDMLSEEDDPDANEEGNETTNTEIVKLDENSNSSNDCKENKTEDTESKEETLWTEEETQLANALWNEVNPKEIYQVKGWWYHMYSGWSTPLREPSDEFTADAVICTLALSMELCSGFKIYTSNCT